MAQKNDKNGLNFANGRNLSTVRSRTSGEYLKGRYTWPRLPRTRGCRLRKTRMNHCIGHRLYTVRKLPSIPYRPTSRHLMCKVHFGRLIPNVRHR